MIKSTDKFKITYEANDGYVGGARPQYTSIDIDELGGNESDQDLKDLFWNEIQRHFQETVNPHSEQEDEFVAWARANMPTEE